MAPISGQLQRKKGRVPRWNRLPAVIV